MAIAPRWLWQAFRWQYGYAITDEQCKARLQVLIMKAFNRGNAEVRDHTLDHYDTMLVPGRRDRVAKLLNSD